MSKSPDGHNALPLYSLDLSSLLIYPLSLLIYLLDLFYFFLYHDLVQSTSLVLYPIRLYMMHNQILIYYIGI